MSNRCAVLAGICGLMAGVPAFAQPETTTTAVTQPADPTTPPALGPTDHSQTDSNGWRWSIEPSAWFVGISGDVRLPRSTPQGTPTGKVELLDLNMDNPTFAPTAEVNIRKGDWRFAARGSFYSADKSATGLDPGTIGDISYTSTDTLHSSLDFTIVEAEAAYTFLGNPKNPQKDGSFAFDPKLDLVFGARVYGADWSIENTTGTGAAQTSESDWFIHPLVGVKFSADFYKDFTADIQVSVGGLPTDHESYSFDVIAGVQWHPTRNFGIQAGYRSLYFDMGSGSGEGEFSFNGAVQGLYAGLVLRF